MDRQTGPPSRTGGGGVGYHLDDGVFKYCRWVCFDRFHLAGFKN